MVIVVSVHVSVLSRSFRCGDVEVIRLGESNLFERARARSHRDPLIDGRTRAEGRVQAVALIPATTA